MKVRMVVLPLFLIMCPLIAADDQTELACLDWVGPAECDSCDESFRPCYCLIPIPNPAGTCEHDSVNCPMVFTDTDPCDPNDGQFDCKWYYGVTVVCEQTRECKAKNGNPADSCSKTSDCEIGDWQDTDKTVTEYRLREPTIYCSPPV